MLTLQLYWTRVTNNSINTIWDSRKRQIRESPQLLTRMSRSGKDFSYSMDIKLFSTSLSLIGIVSIRKRKLTLNSVSLPWVFPQLGFAPNGIKYYYHKYFSLLWTLEAMYSQEHRLDRSNRKWRGVQFHSSVSNLRFAIFLSFSFSWWYWQIRWTFLNLVYVYPNHRHCLEYDCFLKLFVRIVTI